MRRVDRIAGVLLAGLALLAILVVIPSQTTAGFLVTGSLPPGAVPVAAAAAILILALLLLLCPAAAETPDPFAGWPARAFAAAAALLLLAGLGMAYLGALVALPVFAAACMALLGERRPAALGGMAAGVLAFLHLFIERLLGHPLS